MAQLFLRELKKNMEKPKQQRDQRGNGSLPPAQGKFSLWIPGGIIIGLLVVGAGVVALREARQREKQAPGESNAPATTTTQAAVRSSTMIVPPATNSPAVATNIPLLEVNQAVMVTVELDFGPNVPTIAAGLREVERRYQPDDGIGRTFAILDAYGEPTAEGKLHMSMHVSSEKPGLAALVFKRTGEVLWQTRIVPSTNQTKTFTGRDLLVLIDNGPNKSFTIDGSSNPLSILDAKVKELGVPLREIWPDGTEREMTFIYSACGCPVKVKTQRVGDRTKRTKDLPVMFPDDPAVVEVIARLMRW